MVTLTAFEESTIPFILTIVGLAKMSTGMVLLTVAWSLPVAENTCPLPCLSKMTEYPLESPTEVVVKVPTESRGSVDVGNILVPTLSTANSAYSQKKNKYQLET